MSQTPKNDFMKAAIQGTAWRYLAFAAGKLLVFPGTFFLSLGFFCNRMKFNKF